MHDNLRTGGLHEGAGHGSTASLVGAARAPETPRDEPCRLATYPTPIHMGKQLPLNMQVRSLQSLRPRSQS